MFPRFELPTFWALAWTTFTAMSVFLVAVTYRSSSAILAKSIHVVAEAMFLILLSLQFGYYLFTGFVALLVISVVLIALTHQCSETIDVASSSGLVLDAINFLAFAWFGVTRPDDAVLWTFIGGLGWHALYLLSFVGVMVWQMSNYARVWFRVFGMIFNIIAIEFFFVAVKLTVPMHTWGTVNVEEWLEEFPDGTVLPVWTGNGLKLIGPFGEDEPVILNVYEPYRSAYTPRGFYHALYGLFPIWGEVILSQKAKITKARYALLCAYGCFSPVYIQDVSSLPRTQAYVFSWNQFRWFYWLVLAIVGAFVGTYYE